MKDTHHDTMNVLSLAFLEEMHADYVCNPRKVSDDWRRFFDSHKQQHGNGAVSASYSRAPSFRSRSIYRPASAQPDAGGGANTKTRGHAPDGMQDRVDQLVRAYRVRGHMVAKLNPLGSECQRVPELELSHYGFSDEDADRPFSSRTIVGPEVRTLREIVQRMRNTYCRNIGVQFMHIDDLDIRHWLQDRMEGTENRIELSRRQQFRMLTLLTEAVVFEEFIQKKYVGAKSFSLEGCESLIPLLELAIERAAEQGIVEIVIGMAHRGRLNVQANILSKPAHAIFREFDDVDPNRNLGGGDVKHHLGYSGDWESSTGRKVHLSLCFNPSHLEFINPVALGRMRAKQDRAEDVQREKGMVLLIHGDAGFAAEGIVQETLNLSELDAYRIGGTLHVIVNNQIGFTTSPSEGRSSLYSTDVAKMLQIPIFHVNGEDPEGVAQVTRLAMDFRREFERDVVIDMYGYRRHGHNEMDEPSFTQPLLYQAIEIRNSVRDGYLENLLKLGDVSQDRADGIIDTCRMELRRGLSAARSENYAPDAQASEGIWSGYLGGPDESVEEVSTGVEQERLSALLKRLTRVPDDFSLHPKLKKVHQRRCEMAAGERPLDWAAAEALAFASLATDGMSVRLSGQDSARGTFSHRHAVYHDVENGETYLPIQHLAEGQAPIEIYNSPLSEAGVLGFEYGYSLDRPDGLTVWEAQFGDFCNAAQVIIDQFVASAEDKWRRLSGIVLLLPHGFEGQGPEHSSARLERFLLLAAEDNIQVVYPTTPAQYFHCLRRQILRPWRKPLVVMSPKSLLRHPDVISQLDELSEGTFQRVIADDLKDPTDARRILLCSGKIYYELAKRRKEMGRDDVVLIRVEQLYPLSDKTLEHALAHYRDGTPTVWVQEEPENMGAWRYWRGRFGETMLGRLPLGGVHRAASASPATGSASSHKLEQAHLIDKAFGDSEGEVWP
jgi:2-oxoglutarate dehydrogenase E1 component